MPSFLYIASGVMLVHYLFCQQKFQQCPTPFAVGPKGTGKTTAAKVFLSFVGHRQTHLVRQLTEAECTQHCSMSSFPYVYDDPDSLGLVRNNQQLVQRSSDSHNKRDSCAKDGMYVHHKYREARNSTEEF